MLSLMERPASIMETKRKSKRIITLLIAAALSISLTAISPGTCAAGKFAAKPSSNSSAHTSTPSPSRTPEPTPTPAISPISGIVVENGVSLEFTHPVTVNIPTDKPTGTILQVYYTLDGTTWQ